MSKPTKTVLGFALLGLAITGLCYWHAAVHDYTKPTSWFEDVVLLLSLILCPGQLFFAFCIDCEAVGWDGFIMYSIIGAFNAVIYMLVGFLIVGLRRVPDSQTKPLTK